MTPGFWNDPERVDEFAKRDPDHRLVELIKDYSEPSRLRVLDLGCAGGRNAVFLARHGFDVYAVDSAQAMVERTRAELAATVNGEEAERRVLQGEMKDLSRFESGSVALIVALGVFQQAQSVNEWHRSLAEAARVLSAGGRCLVANFGPGTGSVDRKPELIPGTKFVYSGMRYGNACLLTVAQLDEEFARVGLTPEVPSQQVEREADGQRRVTVNALYKKA